MSSTFFDVRMRGFPARAEVEDVLRLLDERIQIGLSEEISLAEAAGRVLSDPVTSSVNVPAFARAAMDGYALRGEDTFGAALYNPLRLRIVGEALPAKPAAIRVETGTAVRIMTGAPVPDGADAVLQAEAASEEDGTVSISEPVSPGRNIGRIGEDVAAGRTVLHAGRRLRPQDLGLLSSIGVGSVAVVRRPAVALLITGDELLPPGSRPDGCRIIDSNSVVLNALIRRDGGIPLPVIYLADRPETIRETLLACSPLAPRVDAPPSTRGASGLQAADVILISGGSSVGKEDHAPRLLAELGELPIHGIALRPASPTGIGFLKGKPVFLLPGNPVSCLCAYDLFAGRALRKLGGLRTDLPYRAVELPLAQKIVSAIGRVDYVRVRITDAGVEPIAVSGASMLSTTVVADGFVLVARDQEGFAPGEWVTVYRYDDTGA